MKEFHDAVAREMTDLTRLVPTPTEPFGFGRDLSCTSDLTAGLAETDPDSPRGIGEAVIRRLTTARGLLLDAPDYGLDLYAFASRGVPVEELRDLAGRIRAEVAKDDRIDEARVSVTMAGANALSVSISIAPADPARDPFDLVFAIVSGRLTVEAIG